VRNVGCRYLYFFINRYYEYINSHPKGTGTPHVNPDIFWNLEFPLPPLNEQKRIVSNLDQIMPKIDRVKARLERVPKIIKRFRQSVLNAAVTGKLTEKWRDEHSNVECAEALFDRIRKEREIKYQEECEKAKKEGRRTLKKYYNIEFNSKHLNELEIPETWTKTYLGNISDVKGGIQKTPKRVPRKNHYPYITVANVYRGFLKLKNINRFEATEDELNNLRLKKNDLLIVEGNGSAKEIGRCAIWNSEIENCIHQNHIIRARPYFINSKYLIYFFNSYFGIDIMMQISSTTSGLYTLSVKKVNNLPLPLPPFEEQHEIVRQVDKYLNFADKLEAHYNKAKDKLDRLPQSVLARAFRGELVPQGPNDEPTEKLLERIKEEKARLELGLKKSRRNSARAHK